MSNNNFSHTPEHSLPTMVRATNTQVTAKLLLYSVTLCQKTVKKQLFKPILGHFVLLSPKKHYLCFFICSSDFAFRYRSYQMTYLEFFRPRQSHINRLPTVQQDKAGRGLEIGTAPPVKRCFKVYDWRPRRETRPLFYTGSIPPGSKIGMFHDLLTDGAIYEQFTDFNGLF